MELCDHTNIISVIDVIVRDEQPQNATIFSYKDQVISRN